MNARRALLAMLMGTLFWSCTLDTDMDEINFEHGLRLTVIHTGDIHSRIFPYDMDLMATDERLGMVQSHEPFGGFAQAATVIKKIRGHAQHSLHVDSGDVFQGAPVFNEFHGEPEIEMFNLIGLDAFIIGNHEFDDGPLNLYDKLSKAHFSCLAANYNWRGTQGLDIEPLKNAAQPYAIIDAQGVKVAVIGMANFSSMSSIRYGDSGLGITVLENIQVVQSYIDLLKNDVNIITMVTHLGLGEDEDVIRKTTGLDVVFGGHLHIVLNPPKNIPDETKDPDGKLAMRMVPLVHSGAFMKYIGHFDGVFYPHEKQPWNLELASHDYKAIPIDSTIQPDASVVHLLSPYEVELARRIDLRKVVGYAPQTLRRFGTGGNDSPLGNFLADNMMVRARVEADFSATNSLGIRTDIHRGPVTNDMLYNVFPFPNDVTSMTLSGNEVQILLDYNTYRSSNRGCQSQLQVAGIRYTLDCHIAQKTVNDLLDKGYLFEFQYRDPTIKFARNIKFVRGTCKTDADCHYSEEGISRCETIKDSMKGEYKACIEDLQPQWFYRFATNNYMARGGSGFTTLKYNTTQKDTDVSLRDITIEGIEKQPNCMQRCIDAATELDPNFDAASMQLGDCKQLLNCKSDFYAYELRACESVYRYSPRDVCLDALASLPDADKGSSMCLGQDKTTPYELCLRAAYPECDRLYFEADMAACREMEEQKNNMCESKKEELSEYETCASKYEFCNDQDNESEYSRCAAAALARAESLCADLPCFYASTDGRQDPRRPHNEALDDEVQINSFSNGVAIMEALQEAGYDACY
ncbi:MAG: bifunctional metallophosphatase/5'-nucleotidase [Bradymonadia bacterium]|jgi:5'-nucleotidase/UDP-sugar diphosphatase